MVCYSRNRGLALIAVLTLFWACKSDQSNDKEDEPNEYVMHQPSEMASLMKAFYDYNETLRKEIIQGDTLTPMPESFIRIHSAEMTDSTGPSEVFKSFAPLYINSQAAVVDSSSTLDVRTRFNDNINMCLSCHKTECVGPIPRIKKLLIQ